MDDEDKRIGTQVVKCLFCRKASKQCNSFIFNLERNLISEFSMLNLVISERTKETKRLIGEPTYVPKIILYQAVGGWW